MYIKPKQDVFLTLTKCFLCLTNLDNLNVKLPIKEMLSLNFSVVLRQHLFQRLVG